MKTIYTFFGTTTFCLMAMLSFGQINRFDNPTIFNAPLTIIDGNEGMGKILSSNAAGLATWQDAALPGQWIKTGSNVLELANDSLNVLVSHTNSNTFITSKFQINNNSTIGFNTAFRVQVDGSTKLALHNNGGLDIGAYSNTGIAPQNGLYVNGDILLGTTTATADHKLSVAGKIATDGLRLESSLSAETWNLSLDSNYDYSISNNATQYLKIQNNTGRVAIGADYVAGCRLSVDGKITGDGFQLNNWNFEVDNNNYVIRTGSSNHMIIQNNTGHVAIGTDFANGHRLSVDGKIACEEVLVKFSGSWPDYVFMPDYDLKTLDHLRQHIAEKGHLPNVPSAAEIKDNGIKVGEMNKILMEKVEELTLYILQQEQRMNKQQEMIDAQAMRLKALECNK